MSNIIATSMTTLATASLAKQVEAELAAEQEEIILEEFIGETGNTKSDTGTSGQTS